MKKLNLMFLCFFIISCGKQTAPPLNLQDSEKEDTIKKITRAVLPEAPEPNFATLEAVINDAPEPNPVLEKEPVVTEDIKDELKVEPILYEDFAWEKYMVEPGDYLIKIAKKEYGDFKIWRYIYSWNKDDIGDNPNLIYPYNFLNLQKERLAAKTAEPKYFDYSVQDGDNLWNIAGKQYGDAKSWIILLWDNEELIKSNAGILNPGMTIKLREKLDPNAS